MDLSVLGNEKKFVLTIRATRGDSTGVQMRIGIYARIVLGFIQIDPGKREMC